MYSQNNEEQIIADFFKDQPGAGKFLDIGAHDGVSLSNTRALFERGWSGTLVEPSPIHFVSLWKLYGGDKRINLVNAAISGNDCGLVEMFFNHEGPAYSSTISPEKAYEFRANDYTKNYFVPVAGVAALERFGPFDFVSIDAEGVDHLIFRESFRLLQGCQLVCIEISKNTETDIFLVAEMAGLKLHAKTPENLFFKK